jgi:dihydroorotase
MNSSPGRRRLLLEGGFVPDPGGGGDGLRRADVFIDDGTIIEVGDGTDHRADADADRVDATGCVVLPGFVDLHVHLREPGREEAETIESGSRAAALGGFTAVVAMPNTDPAQDAVPVVEFVREQGRRAGLCEVLPSGCITIGRRGERLAPFAELAAVGVRIFTDDGNGVQDAALMRRALEYGRDLGIVLAQHCEVASLTAGAVMHEGACCSRLGVPGWPALAEELMVHRDIELSRLTGAPVHLLHLSTRGSVDLVRRAKADGLAVTAEVTPHHLSLVDELLSGFDPLYKVNPPLRTPEDIEALRAGLLDGTIDAIATDHAPHESHTKELPLDEAPPGMLGLETALGVVRSSVDLPIGRLIEVMSSAPARIAGVADRHGRPVAPGEVANLAVVDLAAKWSVDPAGLASRSRNTPFGGRELLGRVRHTVFDGALVVRDGVAFR